MYFSTVVQVLLDNPQMEFYIYRTTWGNKPAYIKCNADAGVFTFINRETGDESTNYQLGLCDMLGCDWRIE